MILRLKSIRHESEKKANIRTRTQMFALENVQHSETWININDFASCNLICEFFISFHN